MNRAALKLVAAHIEVPVEPLVAHSVNRRAWLKRELAAEDARLTVLRQRLASKRGVAFIRVEALEQEFGE